MRGYLKIEGGGALADASGGVVVGPVAGAVVAAEVAGVGDGYATQVGAHPDDDQPLGVLGALLVGLRVAQLVEGHGLLCRDFVRCPVR